jgi:hypothetical protein
MPISFPRSLLLDSRYLVRKRPEPHVEGCSERLLYCHPVSRCATSVPCLFDGLAPCWGPFHLQFTICLGKKKYQARDVPVIISKKREDLSQGSSGKRPLLEASLGFGNSLTSNTSSRFFKGSRVILGYNDNACLTCKLLRSHIGTSYYL